MENDIGEEEDDVLLIAFRWEQPNPAEARIVLMCGALKSPVASIWGQEETKTWVIDVKLPGVDPSGNANGCFYHDLSEARVVVEELVDEWHSLFENQPKA